MNKKSEHQKPVTCYQKMYNPYHKSTRRKWERDWCRKRKVWKIAKDFPNLVKDISLQIQEAPLTQKDKLKENHTQIHKNQIVEIKNKEKISSKHPEKKIIHIREYQFKRLWISPQEPWSQKRIE